MSSTQTPAPHGAEFDGNYALSGDRDGFIAHDGDLAAHVEDTPVQRFRKDLIVAGTYRHPVHGWTLAVTPQRMAAWVAAFARMREQGVDVEVTVDHSPRAAAVQGYLVDMFIDGDRLYGVHEMIGQDAIELARRVKNVSVEIDRDFVDGRGVRYGEAIVRSSLVQQPVVPDQEHFVPIAASLGGDLEGAPRRAPLLLLTHSPHAQTAPTAAPDAGIMEELADFAEQRLAMLVEQGRLTPAAGDRLGALLLGSRTQRPAIMLARAAAREAGFDQPLAKLILDALSFNDVVPLGERTTGQAIALSRDIPGTAHDEPDADTRLRMTQAAYGRA